jgi:protoporphyrinogen oxidase
VLPEVVSGLVEMGVIRGREDIRFARLRRIDYAYVIFDHAYYEALATIEPFLEKERVVSAGRYGRWTYCSMEDAILMGQEAAKTAESWLPAR